MSNMNADICEQLRQLDSYYPHTHTQKNKGILRDRPRLEEVPADMLDKFKMCSPKTKLS